MAPLRGGYKTDDPRLDRLPQFDKRSRNYPIRTLVPKKPRGYTWSVNAWLDQGREGACVGFAWAHELVARPAIVPNVTELFARNAIYKEAQKIDEWAGEDYEGTSVLAGVKVIQRYGFIKEYRWAFGLEDLILALGYAGPAVLGVNWYAGMGQADSDGFISPTGSLRGGHAILAKAVNVKQEFVTLHNSWGADWGLNGTAKIRFADLDRLLREDGEACVVMGRKRIIQTN